MSHEMTYGLDCQAFCGGTLTLRKKLGSPARKSFRRLGSQGHTRLVPTVYQGTEYDTTLRTSYSSLLPPDKRHHLQHIPSTTNIRLTRLVP